MKEDECKDKSEACVLHKGIEERVDKLEEIVNDVRLELKQKSISDAEIRQTISLVAQVQNQMATDVRELRKDMLGLVTQTLTKSQEDMATFIKMNEKNDEKEREYKRQQEAQLSKAQQVSEERDKAFYRKLIIGCMSVGATIVLAFFGIKALIPVFGLIII